MRDISDKLRIVRKFTGDRFSVARGYDARKPLSRGRLRTINKYYEMVRELTDRPHKIIVPRKGAKRETFHFTGQLHHPRFTKAILVLPDADAKYTYIIDKARPKGSRFVLINKKTREKSWHIPASAFLDENELLYEPDEDLDPSFFEDVLDMYAEKAEVYMIEAGDYHMWGSAGDIPHVAEKLAELFKNYGSDIFDINDKSSHHIKNWFRGVQAFAQAEAITYRMERAENEARRIREFNNRAGRNVMRFGVRFRVLPSGDIGEFHSGRLVTTHRAANAKQMTRDKVKTSKPRSRPKRQ